MRTVLQALLALVVVSGQVVFAQEPAKTASEPAPQSTSEAEQLRAEIDLMKKTIAALEERLAAQEKKQQAEPAAQPDAATPPEAVAEVANQVKQLDRRVALTERHAAIDRVRIGGDYRFEAHTIRGEIPAHYDGMKLQNLLVKTMFSMNALGRPPASVDEINATVANNYSDYLYMTQNLTFDQLKQQMAQFPDEMRQQLMGMLLPSTYVPETPADNGILYTNRFRIRLDTDIAPNVSVSARLSMYKVFGDSTNVQVFNGQPTSVNIDGTTAGVPTGDMIRVDRAFFTWNDIGGSKFFFSVGRRPSTAGPPMHLREDELRAGTPSGALINYQFDGVTFGYHAGERTVLRLCYGLGYESGFGNGDLVKRPEDRLDDVHFLGANVDIWNTERTLVQATFARAFDVTDGFNGLVVLPVNPLTGDEVGAPVVMRFTPSANLGNINLGGVNVMHKFSRLDTFVSANWVGFRPNDVTTPFGGMVSDPFETPENHDGFMIYAGARFNFGNEERTKLGFEFNHGSKYWFNFAQAEDDIIAPKTNTRGEVYETYLTHRITSRFIFKVNYLYYLYDYSGSGWHVGAPKQLDETPILGFPTYKRAQDLTFGLMVRF